MKHFLLLASLTICVSNFCAAQILCIYCYHQNDSLSTGVTNILLNGGFENTNCIANTGTIGSQTSFCPNSNGYSCDFSNWTCTGGGHDTYCCLYDVNVNKSIIIQGTNAVYFGNFYANACSNNSSDTSCLISLGCTATGIPNGYPKNTAAYGGQTGVSLQQTANGLIPGHVYVLEFWAGGEESYPTKGIFTVDVGFGDTLLRCVSTGPGEMGYRYIIEFQAVSSSQTIKFTSWGHISSSTELVLDDVRLYPVSQLTSSVPSCAPLSSGSFSASDTAVCEKFCIDFFDSSTNNPTAWQWLFPGGNPSSSNAQNPASICYNTPGQYDVTLITTTANGNDTVTMPNYITIYTTPAFPTITQSGFTLTSSTATSYQWQFNSVDIPGATNQSYIVTQSGYYTVVVSDSNGCANSATQYFLIEGVQDVIDDSGISIYPNPSTGEFTLTLPAGISSSDISLSAVNTLGKNISSSVSDISSSKMEVILDKAAPGLYFIEIRSGNKVVRKKMVIE